MNISISGKKKPYRANLSLIPAVFLVASAFPVHAGGGNTFSLDFSREIAISLPGAVLFACGHFLTDGQGPEREALGWFDDGWTCPYDESLDTIGTLASVTAVAALPLLLDAFTPGDVSVIAVMYAESTLWTLGLKDVLKAAFGRPRPYLSRSGTPESLLADDDRFYSFPSGHTAYAFMTASFVSYIYCRGDSSRTGKTLLSAGAFALAGATATLRVIAGVHYPSDVLAGALIGTAVGLIVPWLHEKKPEGWNVSLVGDSMTVSYSY